MTRIGINIIIALVCISFALAAPIPLGVDGIVYGLDNITRADSSVSIRIIDLNNTFTRFGNLRKDGSFSATITGEINDTINITVWNERNSSSRLIKLDGTMHNQDIILDLIKLPENEDKPEPPRRKNKKKLKEPKVITGIILDSGKPVEDIIDYKITVGDEVIEGKTQEGFPGYAEVIYAKEGEDIKIELKNKEEESVKNAKITGAVIREDVDFNPYYWLKDILTYIAFLIPMVIPFIILFRRMKN